MFLLKCIVCYLKIQRNFQTPIKHILYNYMSYVNCGRLPAIDVAMAS